jgi:phospholipase/carboxylesterase
MPLVSYRITRPGAERLLFLFHGWSSEQHHLAAYVPLIDPDGHFSAICPRAIHDLPEGDGASWYDRVDGEPVAASFVSAVDTVQAFVTDEIDAAGIDPDRCIIGGFSQGGFLVLALALRAGAPRFGGVWAMCCGMPEITGLDLDLSPGSGGGRPALIQVGELDQIMAPERGRAAAAALDSAGWNVTVAGYPMAHTQRLEMMSDARTWLA